VAVHVDESRCNDKPGHIDGVARSRVIDCAQTDIRDPVATDADVLAHPWIAGAVQHAPVDEQHIERRSLAGRRQRQREQNDAR
jgi:hypothetical protein